MEEFEQGKMYEGIKTNIIILCSGSCSDKPVFSGVVISKESLYKIGTYSKTWHKTSFKLLK